MYGKNVKCLLLLLVVLGSFSLPAMAGKDGKAGNDGSDDKWPYSDLGGSRWGELTMGPEVNRKAMEGKVVLVCMMSLDGSSKLAMKKMVKLDRTYRKSGLFVIADSWRGRRQDDFASIAKEFGVRFSIVCYANYKIKVKRRKGVKKRTDDYIWLPYGVIYGPEGKILWEGKFPPSYRGIDRIVRKYIKRAKSKEQLKRERRIRQILDGGDYSNIKSTVKLIKRGKLGAAHKACLRLKDKEGDIGEQAESLLGNLDAFATEEFAALDSLAGDSPSGAMKQVLWLKKAFAGCKYCDQAKAKQAAWKKDKVFQKNLKAEKAFLKFAAKARKIPLPGDYEGGPGNWRRKYSRKLQSLKDSAKRFCSKYPDSCFVDNVDNILAEFSEDAEE